DAAKEYEEAYRIKSDPVLLFNIGQAYRLGGEHADALRSYKAYLRRLPEAPNRREVEVQIARLQRLIDEQRAAPPAEPTRRPPARPRRAPQPRPPPSRLRPSRWHNPRPLRRSGHRSTRNGGYGPRSGRRSPGR